MGLFSRLLAAEPALALELPRLQLDAAGRSADVLTVLMRSLDAAAALQQPDLDLMGATHRSRVCLWAARLGRGRACRLESVDVAAVALNPGPPDVGVYGVYVD